jgi:hypothetical protein
MYNQYLDGSEFVLLEPEPQNTPPGHHQGQPNQRPQGRPGQSRPASRPMGQSKNDLVGEVTSGLTQLLDGVLKHFSLENFDTGDILLVLIILFLYLEGDNLELVITLGLMLLLGLGDDKPKGEAQSSQDT